MERYEMVEKLREKANVSYEEAKVALEACDWDILDALVMLESEGKVQDKATANYSTQQKKSSSQTYVPPKKVNWEKVRAQIKKVIDKGNSNYFVIKRKGAEIFRLPLTAFIILAVLLFHFTIVAFIVGLFVGARYSVEGAMNANNSVNKVMDKAADAVNNVKQSFEGEEKDGQNSADRR